MTSMQIQVTGLLQVAVPLFPTAEVRQPPPTASMLGEGEPQQPFPFHTPHSPRPACGELAACPQPSPGASAPSFGSEGLFAHPVCSSICVPSPIAHALPLPPTERSPGNPAPAELFGDQPSSADGHAGLPRAAQGAGVTLGVVRKERGAPEGHIERAAGRDLGE